MNIFRFHFGSFSLGAGRGGAARKRKRGEKGNTIFFLRLNLFPTLDHYTWVVGPTPQKSLGSKSHFTDGPQGMEEEALLQTK